MKTQKIPSAIKVGTGTWQCTAELGVEITPFSPTLSAPYKVTWESWWEVLAVSFLECFPLDHIAELKHDHFYGRLHKRLKAMVAYLKASANEKTYSDYIHAAGEAEKEEVMEPSCSQTVATTSKPTAMSFFPLQKLKGSQPTKTPTVQVAHLEEEGADKEECTDIEDPDGMEGVTKEFIVCLARAVKDAQQEEKHCYHCSSWDHFVQACPLVVASRNRLTFKPKGGYGTDVGSPDPSRKGNHAKGAPRQDAQGIKCHTDSLLGYWSFNQLYGIKNVARVRVNGKSCIALLDNSTQINTITLGFIENHSLDMGPLLDLMGGQSCLHRPGKCTYPPCNLCHHMGSSRQSPGLWWGPDSPGNLVFVQFHGMGPHDLGNPHDKPHHECDKGDGDRHPSDTMGNCLGGISFGSLTSYSHSGRWQGCCWSVRPYWVWWASQH